MRETETDAILALADSDPAAFILRAADLREQRASTVNEGGPGIWYVGDGSISGPGYRIADVHEHYPDNLLTEHIAAEANPDHALAAVRHWRGVVDRHVRESQQLWEHSGLGGIRGSGRADVCKEHRNPVAYDDCPDLAETVADARAYLSGGTA